MTTVIYELTLFLISVYLASGSWSGVCKIWVSKAGAEFSLVVTLPDHTHAVQCRILSNGTVVTGSQDGSLNIYDLTGNLIQRRENSHDDIIRQIKEFKFGDVSQSTGSFSKSKFGRF